MADAHFTRDFLAKLPFHCLGELVTMRGWPKSNDFKTSTASPASYPVPRFEASSGIPAPSSSPSTGAEKNALPGLRASLPHLLRQAVTPRPRPVLWLQTGVPRVLGAQDPVLRVRRRETRTLGLACRQPAVYQTLCLL